MANAYYITKTRCFSVFYHSYTSQSPVIVDTYQHVNGTIVSIWCDTGKDDGDVLIVFSGSIRQLIFFCAKQAVGFDAYGIE